MGIAFFTANSLFAPLQNLLGWFMGPSPTAHHVRPPAQARAATVPAYVRRTEPVRPRPDCTRVAAGPVRVRPLRVLRVADGCTGRAGAGRMVISGRMADVCAELDRLAAAEATTLH